jgi:hypothetical protein
MVTADLLSRAQAGDGEAFRELTESHRRELPVHSYRMLGCTRIAIGNREHLRLGAVPCWRLRRQRTVAT